MPVRVSYRVLRHGREWLPQGQFIHGRALFELGQVAEGLAELETGIAGCQRLARKRLLGLSRGSAVTYRQQLAAEPQHLGTVPPGWSATPAILDRATRRSDR
jgi:hypothetical protein